MLLERAQQLGLQVHGQVANLIEKKRALPGRFEQPLFGMLRARERTFHVPE